MRILIAHNYYQQAGGEDRVFADEAHLLETKGHEISRYSIRNDQIASMGSLALAGATLWNRQIYRQLRSRIRQDQPHVIHFHNTFPLISPAGYYAARAEGVPVVQTLHNYRLLCPSAIFFRDGRICEDCAGKAIPWPGVVHRCYRGSRAATGATAAMLVFHRLLQTWKKAVDVFIACSQFARDKFVAGGLSPDKLVCKPNFLYPAPEPGQGEGGYALFVGRFAPEKGLETLLAAWEQLPDMPLKIVGDGPCAQQVAAAAERLPQVEWLGLQPRDAVYDLMGNAAFLIVPSEWYETFGLVAIEAFAKGTPALVANIGAIAELVTPGQNGLHFRPGDSQDLVEKVDWLRSHPADLTRMGQNARTTFETHYTAEANYQMLMQIYDRVRGNGERGTGNR